MMSTGWIAPVAALSVAAGCVLLSGGAPRAQEAGPRFVLRTTDFLVDEEVPLRLLGLSPHAVVTLHAVGGSGGIKVEAHAEYSADADGVLDVAHSAAAKGTYHGVDAMGLFWSAIRSDTAASVDDDQLRAADVWTISADAGGREVARTSIRRRAFMPEVRLRRIQESGLIGVLYEPPGSERHPAFIVLGGSGGGIPPPVGPAGGLASRGYAVLALAYFGAPGLPRQLSNIPLEYFGAALRWLASQPSVDPQRIGVVGSSRGAEAALLIGATFPAVRSVIAYMPSNVVWPGCCDASTPVAWTAGGRPLAPVGAPGRRMAPASRPEIEVEKIHGGVLLIAGRDDEVWPSATMADAIVARLKRHHFTYPYRALVYDHAGHAITRPFTSTMQLDGLRHPISGRIQHMGGAPAGTAFARSDSWPQVLAFAESSLR